MKLKDIASVLDGVIEGDGEKEISRVSKIEEAGAKDITFISNPKYEKHLTTTQAGAIIIGRNVDITNALARGIAFIRVDDPYVGFVKTIKLLMPPPDPFPSDVHQTAVISKTARIGKGVVLGAFTVIEDEVNIGDGTKIAHNVVVGRGSKIGNDCRIFSNVTIYYGSKIGNRVIIHSGTVVGSDGFGFAPKKDGTYEKIPQLGIVHIEDDVELGANLCIDRATLGETRICKGVKLDNLIQVAHNCYIGENTVMAALSGLAGTTKVGKNVMVGGNVGMAGHLEIADKTVIMAKSGVSKSITEPGKTYFGVPAKEAKRAFRIESMIRSLPELAKQVSDLEKKMKELEAELAKWSETK